MGHRSYLEIGQRRKMNVAVIGSGGREHALCWKIRQSSKVQELFCIPGNGGTKGIAHNVSLDITKNQEIKDFCKAHNIGLVVVGPEAALAGGITDVLEKENIRVFGPSLSAARLESSKIFAKEIMAKYKIPTAESRVFDNLEDAEEYVKTTTLPVVIKADGLASGKGVIICAAIEDALHTIREILKEGIFGTAGNRILVEEFLEGEEVSIMAMTDGTTMIPLSSSPDHKRVGDGDKGPNTGGMGAYSPATIVDGKLFDEIKRTVLQPTINAMRSEGVLFKGVLYAGLMITKNGPKVLEFNARFGDPELQVLLTRVKSDIVDVFEQIAAGKLKSDTIEWEQTTSVCVVLASGGYPGKFEKGKEITGIKDAEKEGAIVFHSGTTEKEGKYFTSGGRVLNIVGRGPDITKAVQNAYNGVNKIKFDDMHFRRDIGARELNRQRGI